MAASTPLTPTQPATRGIRNLSTWLVIGITLLALAAGWLVKSSVQAQTRAIQQEGVSAQGPRGWALQTGIHGEEMIFTLSDPLDINLRYITSLMPAVPGGTVEDVVVTRNLKRAEQLNAYRVLNQAPAQVLGQTGYRVDFAYVVDRGPSKLPVVIRGVDFYSLQAEKVLVATLEEDSKLFDSVYPSFLTFLGSLSYAPGGNQ